MNTPDHFPPEIVYDEDLIVIYRGLDEELCGTIIDFFDRGGSKRRGKIVTSEDIAYEQEIKNSWDMEILNEGAWRDIFQTIHSKIRACLSHYISKSPLLQSFNLQVTGYKVQMYPKNQGYFRWHADSLGKDTGDRVVAMILYLNDVEKGGETEFFHQEIKIIPKAGNLVLFPAGWTYMHCGHTPESGDKYIIQSFVKIKGLRTQIQ